MKEILLKDYKKPDYLIPEVELYVNILDSKVVVKSILTVNKSEPGSVNPFILNGKELVLKSIAINDTPLTDYNYNDEKLVIENLPDKFSISTEVEIDPINNKSMEGFYKSGNILCTQNEAEGFRRITFFPDRPDIMSSYTIAIEGDRRKYPYLLANGNLVETVDVDSNRVRNIWVDPFAKPCYLVALVAGDLDKITDTYTTISGRDVRLEIFTDPGKSSQALHAMESLKKAMKWDEEVFGLEYDLDLYMIVAVDSFNAGAMENKGLNIFNSAYVLANPETATDSDFEAIEGVIAHEYFHNWTGNRVTCRDWFQLTLKEGLTVFRDQNFSMDMTDKTVKRIADVSVLRSHQFPEDRGPNSHPIKPKSYMTIDNFYTATVYEKGAEVIRMIHTLIGRENFRKGMDLYFKRHTGEAVTTEDFVGAMADASGYNLDQFKRWYNQAGTPIVDVESEFSDGEFRLKIKQTIPETSYNGEREPLLFPCPIGLYSKDGKDFTTDELRNFIVSRNEHKISVKSDKVLIPSILQSYSAPVIVNYNYSTEDLITLLNWDKDEFNRFDAARRLVMISVKKIIEDLKKHTTPLVDKRIINSFKTILESNMDERYLASLLYLPETKDIVMLMDSYDFILAEKARKSYISIIAESLKSTLFRTFENNVEESYSFNRVSVSKRTLKNKVLSILSYLEDDITEVALKQFRTSDNMSDYVVAYSSLQNCDKSIREEANREFSSKWRENFLVMNKWFMIQASRTSDTILSEIMELEKNPLFDKTNPNRIRSLYGSFAIRNPAGFHKEDGSGYRFIAERIIEIDSYNSHVSASLASAFQAYGYLEDDQAELMKEELERIMKTEGISTGLFEIVSKTLKVRP